MEEAQQEWTSAGESASREPQHLAQRPVTFGAEVRGDGALEPGPRTFDRVELWRVGRQTDQREPVLLALGEVAGRHAPVRIDAIPDHDHGTGVMLVEPLQEADDVL